MSNDFDRGRRVGKYEILTRVSVGGMAELYLAFLPGPGGFRKFVALKQILPDVRSDEQFVKMFLDEARITAALTHPHIGQVFDLGRDEASGELYLAMEFIAGQNLASVMRAAKRAGLQVPLPIAVRIVRDMCLALHAAHTFVDPAGKPMPITHRDVSPKNVMVSYAGHVKVIDFGIAKARGRLIRTRTGQVRGTLAYMAPEQLDHEPKVDGRTDLYAVGIVLHELLTGERLFTNDAAAVTRALQPPADPRDKNPDVPPALAQATVRALEPDPKRRFEDAKAFARALDAAGVRPADEETVAAFMKQLFATQLASSQALFEAAQADTTGDQLPPLVHPQSASNALATPQRPGATVPARRRGARWAIPAALGGAALLGTALFLASRSSAEHELATPPPAVPLTGVTPAKPPPAPDLSLSLRRADSAMTSGDFARALAAYEDVLKLAPDHWTARAGAGSAALKLHRYDVARAHLAQAATATGVSEQRRGQAQLDLAGALAQLGETDAALAAVQQAMQLAGREALEGQLRFDPALEPLRGNPDFPSFSAPATPTEPAPAAHVAGAYPSPGPEPPALYEAANALSKNRNYEAAAIRLERCVKIAPTYAPCFKALGSTWARIATRDQSTTDREKARKAYQRFLEVAAPDDPDVPKVRSILEAIPR